MKSIHICGDGRNLRRCQDIVLSALTLLHCFWYNFFENSLYFLYFLCV